MTNPESGPRGPETPQSKLPEQLEVKESMVDAAYASSVYKFFGDRKSEIGEPGKPKSEEDVQREAFLNEQEAVLVKVSDKRRLEKMQPKDVSFALAEVVGVMGATNLFRENYRFEHEGFIGEPNALSEKYYIAAKKLFMDSCRKLFPKVKPELSGAVPIQQEKKLEEAGITSARGPKDILEAEKFLRNDPRELASWLDSMITLGGLQMREQSTQTTNIESFPDFDDPEKVDEVKNRLGQAIEPLYKLQLMRDAMTKRIYGREDITPSEAWQIDKARERLK